MIYFYDKNKSTDTNNYIDGIENYSKELMCKCKIENMVFLHDEEVLFGLFDEVKSAAQDILDRAEKKSNEIILNAKIQADVILSTAIDLSCKTLKFNEV